MWSLVKIYRVVVLQIGSLLKILHVNSKMWKQSFSFKNKNPNNVLTLFTCYAGISLQYIFIWSNSIVAVCQYLSKYAKNGFLTKKLVQSLLSQKTQMMKSEWNQTSHNIYSVSRKHTHEVSKKSIVWLTCDNMMKNTITFMQIRQIFCENTNKIPIVCLPKLSLVISIHSVNLLYICLVYSVWES